MQRSMATCNLSGMNRRWQKSDFTVTETTSHVRIRKVLWKRNDVFRSKAERCGPIGTGLVRSTCWTKDKVGIP